MPFFTKENVEQYRYKNGRSYSRIIIRDYRDVKFSALGS